jgi:hypothetical protein
MNDKPLTDARDVQPGQTTYSYGDPSGPTPNDPRFEDELDAVQAARDKSMSDPLDEPIYAVWHDEDGAVICLVWNGVSYYP